MQPEKPKYNKKSEFERLGRQVKKRVEEYWDMWAAPVGQRFVLNTVLSSLYKEDREEFTDYIIEAGYVQRAMSNITASRYLLPASIDHDIVVQKMHMLDEARRRVTTKTRTSRRNSRLAMLARPKSSTG